MRRHPQVSRGVCVCVCMQGTQSLPGSLLRVWVGGDLCPMAAVTYREGKAGGQGHALLESPKRAAKAQSSFSAAPPLSQGGVAGGGNV